MNKLSTPTQQEQENWNESKTCQSEISCHIIILFILAVLLNGHHSFQVGLKSP